MGFLVLLKKKRAGQAADRRAGMAREEQPPETPAGSKTRPRRRKSTPRHKSKLRSEKFFVVKWQTLRENVLKGILLACGDQEGFDYGGGRFRCIWHRQAIKAGFPDDIAIGGVLHQCILVAAKGGRAHGTLLLEERKAAGSRAALKQGAWADNRRLRAQAGHKSGLTGRNIGRRFLLPVDISCN